MAFQNIGLSSAEAEALQFSDRFRESFVDVDGIYGAIRNRDVFYLIGPKGAGKSAIAEFARLDAIADSYAFFADVTQISDLPHGAVGKLIAGGGESTEFQYIRSWKYLLCLRLYQSLAKEPGLESDANIGSADLEFLLSRSGLLEAETLADMVIKSKRQTLLAKLKGIGVARETLQDFERINADTLYETLRDYILHLRPQKQHIIFLDGLDTVFSTSASLQNSISGLLQASYDLNMEMKKRDFPYTFVVLVRDDMLDRVSTPDISKHTHDFGRRLRWFSVSTRPEETQLWAIVNKRASLLSGREFYAEVELLGDTPGGPTNAVKWIFERSRHRPRDVIMFMNEVLRITHGRKATGVELDAAYNRYSETCFLKEIKDELKAHLEAGGRDQAMLLLKLVGNTDFVRDDAIEASKQSDQIDSGQVDNLLAALFECSAIGHVVQHQSGAGARNFIFKYRNDAETYVPTRPMMVHRGLWRVLNI
jgi:hypothetical protein